MAELAAAGSLVGLISLGIQSCQGLTSYYSAWKSYDEQISQTYRNVNELRITCENLERELRRIDRDQAPAVEQVSRLIVSCQDGIDSLRYALQRCHSTQIPQNLAAKIHSYRSRALYPFRKQTLQSLRDTVHNMQGNLSFALQILQLYVKRYSIWYQNAKATFVVIFRLDRSKDLHPSRELRMMKQTIRVRALDFSGKRCFRNCRTSPTMSIPLQAAWRRPFP